MPPSRAVREANGNYLRKYLPSVAYIRGRFLESVIVFTTNDIRSVVLLALELSNQGTSNVSLEVAMNQT